MFMFNHLYFVLHNFVEIVPIINNAFQHRDGIYGLKAPIAKCKQIRLTMLCAVD